MSSDSLQALEEVSLVASEVATEIRAAFNAHNAPRWTQVGGDEKAVRFDVHINSLAGKSIRELDATRDGDIGGFRYQLMVAGSRYVGGRKTGATLHGIGIDQMESEDGIYTGKVTIHDGSAAWDYDL